MPKPQIHKYIGIALLTAASSRVNSVTVCVGYIRPMPWHAHVANYFSEIFRNRYLRNLDPQKFSSIWYVSED